MTTTAGLAAGGIAIGVVFGSFADNSSKRQQAFVANMILSDQNKIHIYRLNCVHNTNTSESNVSKIQMLGPWNKYFYTLPTTSLYHLTVYGVLK